MWATIALIGGAAGCGASRWTPPVPVPGLKPGAPLRSPTVAAAGGRVIVAGDTLLALDSTLFRPHPLAVVSLDGSDLGAPAGEWAFRHPLLLPDRSRGLHLLWGEPTELPTRTGEISIGPTNRLLYSHYDGRWSPPVTLVDRWDVRWGDNHRQATVDDRGRLHILVPLADSTGAGLRHLTLDDGDLQSTPTSMDWAAYLSVAPGGPAAGIGFIQGDADAGPNSVFFVRQADDGTWPTPRLVQPSGGDQATRIALLTDPDGTIHLVWTQNRSGGIRPEALRHVASRDSGSTWSDPDDAPLDPGLLGLAVVTDRCGTIHAVYSHFDKEGIPRLQHLRRNADGWAPAEPLFPQLPLAFEPVMGRDAQGAAVLVFTGTAPEPGGSAPIAALYSVLRRD